MSKLGIVLKETAAPQYTPVAGEGFLYVKDDTPNRLHYVDDAGTDHVMPYPQAIMVNSFSAMSANGYILLTGVGAPEFGSNYILTRDGVLRNFYVSLSNNSGAAGQFYNVDVRINGVDVITSTINFPDTTYSDTVTESAVTAGDTISFFFTRTVSASAVTVRASVMFN